MKTYLVTGGAGFIGSNFIYYLFEIYDKEIFIINLDKLTYAGNLSNLEGIKNRENYIFIRGDICDKETVENIFQMYDIDYVVNFAAESHVDRSIKNSTEFIRANILGAHVLLDTAKKYWQIGDFFEEGKKFLQVSTDEVYGSLGNKGYFNESTPLDPHSPYSASKASADLIVKSYFDTYKMPVNITRCSNNYGPYQFPEKLIPLIINNCLNGKEIPVYGDGKNVRDWIYVKDHCKAIDFVLNQGKIGEVYNIGGHNEKQNIEVVKIIIRILRDLLPASDSRKKYISENLIKFVKDRKGHDKRYAIDPTKINKTLKWYPETDFNDGITLTIEWYLNNQEWLKNVTSGDYLKYYDYMYNRR